MKHLLSLRNSVVILLTSLSVSAFAVEQVISTDPVDISVSAEETTVSFKVTYAAGASEWEQTTGVGVNLHYDSSVLTFVSLVANDDVSDSLGDGEKAEDPSSADSSSSTDRVAYTSYTNTKGEFPEVQFIKDGAIFDLPLPVELYTITFEKVSATFEGSTTLNFTTSTGPSNEVKAEPVVIVFKSDEVKPTLTLAETSITIEAEGPLTDEDNSQALKDFIATISVADNKDTLTTDDIEAYLTENGELVNFDGFSPGEYEVTLIVKDSSLNESEPAVVTVTVVDTTMPVLSGVANVALSAVNKDGAPSADVLSATALDPGFGEVAVVYSVGGADLGANFPLGETTVTVKAADAAGNMAEGSLVVTVTDTNSPIIASTAYRFL